MGKQTWLDEIGLTKKDLPENIGGVLDWNQKRKDKKADGVIHSETFDLAWTFALWLFSRLRAFKKASTIVDWETTGNQAVINGKEYNNIMECIDEILSMMREYFKIENEGFNIESEDRQMEIMETATKMFAEILPWLWW